MRIVLRREAEAELIATAHYYESARPGLGVAFLNEAEQAIAAAAEFPSQWRVVRGDIRRGLLKRFPYAFYYWEKSRGAELEVLSVSHTKRHPFHWIARRSNT